MKEKHCQWLNETRSEIKISSMTHQLEGNVFSGIICGIIVMVLLMTEGFAAFPSLPPEL